VSAVAARQHRRLDRHQALEAREHPLQEVLGLQRRVLATRAQLQPDVPAFVAKVGRNRRVAVETLVGPADLFLLGAAVVHREGVEVQADKPLVGAHRGFGALEQTQRQFVGVLAQHRPLRVEPLAQPFAAGHFADIERLTEKAVAAKRLDRCEVVLAQRHQPDHALDQVSRRHARRYRHPSVQHQGHLRRFAALADQRQPRVGGQLAVGFSKLEARHGSNG